MLEILVSILVLVLLLYSGRSVYRGLTQSDATAKSVLDVPESDGSARRSLRHLLRVLEVDLEPLFFIAGLVLSATAVSLVFLTVFPGRLGLALVAGISFLPAVVLLMRDLAVWRAYRFESALVDVLDLMSALTASGISPLQAIETAAKGAERCVRVPILGVVARLKLGDTIDNATFPLLRLYETEGNRLFVMALRSRWHDGGHFESLLRALSSALRQRRSWLTEMRGQLSGAKYALFFAAAFPYVLIPFFMWKEPSWLLPLTDNPMGPALLYTAILCQVFGLLWMRSILRNQTW